MRIIEMVRMALILVGLSLAAQAQVAPDALVNNFYQAAQAKPLQKFTADELDDYFTPSLVVDIKKAASRGLRNLLFDDKAKISDLRVKVEQTNSADSSLVTVKFTMSYPNEAGIEMDVTQEVELSRSSDASWRISEITTSIQNMPKVTLSYRLSRLFEPEELREKAIKLVRPEYPNAARAVRAAPRADVKVEVDENGNVVSAKMTSGHPLLKEVSESAALQSKFSPHIVDGKSVRVSGIITYAFTT